MLVLFTKLLQDSFCLLSSDLQFNLDTFGKDWKLKPSTFSRIFFLHDWDVINVIMSLVM